MPYIIIHRSVRGDIFEGCNGNVHICTSTMHATEPASITNIYFMHMTMIVILHNIIIIIMITYIVCGRLCIYNGIMVINDSWHVLQAMSTSFPGTNAFSSLERDKLCISTLYIDGVQQSRTNTLVLGAKALKSEVEIINFRFY